VQWRRLELYENAAAAFVLLTAKSGVPGQVPLNHPD
jgi:hypothetical protein